MSKAAPVNNKDGQIPTNIEGQKLDLTCRQKLGHTRNLNYFTYRSGVYGREAES